MSAYAITYPFYHFIPAEDDPELGPDEQMLRFCKDCVADREGHTEGRVPNQDVDDTCDGCDIDGRGRSPEELEEDDAYEADTWGLAA